MKITLSHEEMHYIALAEDVTGAPIIDCIEMEDRITYIVEKGKLGKAIGKNAKNIKTLEKMLRKEVKFVEYDKDKKSFITNLFKPYKLDEVVVMEGDEGTIVNVTITQDDKGKAIGKNGRNINILREIAKRHHDIIKLKIL
ncbi:MAG TPA: NusA-like transcription termination signal-binding factor [Thermoplasmatales archaeon]|nr:NusA-like transcription termination signal-binding factor [Thermoplasmata archaeon]RLF49739.1 MAG: NusA-like transcription termination signal-binding factor [Thermoplasmata archaeon]HDH81616.1 NusA-like transcription termination signal-binding factor [Thermoplasmatales archaeon]